MAWADLGRTQTMAVPAGPLDGCYFTLAAVRGTEAEARARQLVQEQGGRVFTETTLQRISGAGCGLQWAGAGAWACAGCWRVQGSERQSLEVLP